MLVTVLCSSLMLLTQFSLHTSCLLCWQDLIKYTPTGHADYDLLQKTLKLAQHFLENLVAPETDRDNVQPASCRLPNDIFIIPSLLRYCQLHFVYTVGHKIRACLLLTVTPISWWIFCNFCTTGNRVNTLQFTYFMAWWFHSYIASHGGLLYRIISKN